MRNKLVWASVLSMAMLLTACGEKTEDPESKSETQATTAVSTEAATEETTEVTTEAATEETTEGTTAAETEQAPAGTEGDEAAQVQAVIDGYMKAAEDKDYKSLVKYYDIELTNYMTTGVMASEAELIEAVKSEFEYMVINRDEITVGAPVCASEMIQEYNDFLASDALKEVENDAGETVTLNMTENFKIDGVYSFNYVVSSPGISVDTDMTVLRINGEWKVDNALTMLMAFSSMFENMSEAE